MFFIQYCTVYKIMTICFFNGVFLAVIFCLKLFAKKTYFGCFHFFSARHMLPKLIIINQNESAFSTGKLCFLWKWKKRLHHRLFSECSRPRKTRPAGCGSQVSSNINGTIYLCCLTIQYLSNKYLKRCMTLKNKFHF